ncbi:MAG TPA: hypothetical protein VMU64_04135 [Acidimicrobiales bacterium]|nr:hypothetical protein [Acidimicrobiales bacterium]
MKRLLALVVVGALCTAAAGCDLSPDAATVNGLTISQSEFQGQLSVISGSTVAQCALSIEEAQSGGTLPTVAGSGQSTVSTRFAAFALNGLVAQTLEESALAKRHAAVTTSDLAAARKDYISQVEAASTQVTSPCNLTGADLVNRLPKAFVDSQVRALAAQEKLEEVVGHIDVSPTAVHGYYNTHRAEVTQLCLNFIIASDQASAQTIHDRIAAGTTFADASKGVGVDANTPPGGAGPCVFPSDVVSQLGQTTATAVEGLADGQLAPPQGISVPNQTTGVSQTIWIVISVRAHQLVSFANTEAGLRQEILAKGGPAFSTALGHVVRSASVELDPRYGTWNPNRGVAAPTPPKPAFVLNPSHDGSTSGSSILGSGGQSAG